MSNKVVPVDGNNSSDEFAELDSASSNSADLSFDGYERLPYTSEHNGQTDPFMNSAEAQELRLRISRVSFVKDTTDNAEDVSLSLYPRRASSALLNEQAGVRLYRPLDNIANLAGASGEWQHDFGTEVRCCHVDGNTMAIGFGKIVRLIAIDTGNTINSFTTLGEVCCCHISNTNLAVGDESSTITVWDYTTGDQLYRQRRIHGPNKNGGAVKYCAIEGSTLTYYVENKMLRVLKKNKSIPYVYTRDLDNNGVIKHTIDTGGSVRCLALCQSFIAAGGEAKQLGVWDAEDGVLLWYFQHDAWVKCCTIAKHLDSFYLVAGDEAHLLTVRDIQTGGTIFKFKHEGSLTSCGMTGGYIAAAAESQSKSKVIVRDVVSGAAIECYEHPNNNKIRSCELSKSLIVTSNGTCVMARDMRAGVNLMTIEHKSWINCFATCGHVFATGNEGSGLTMHNITTGECQFTWTMGGAVRDCAVLGNLVAACDDVGSFAVREWQTKSEQSPLFATTSVKDGKLLSILCCGLACVEDKTYAVCGGKAGNLEIFLIDPTSLEGAVKVKVFHHDSWIRCCSILDSKIAVGDEDGNLKLYDIATMSELEEYKHSKSVRCCTLTPRWLAAGDDDYKFVIRDRMQGSRVHHEYKHEDRVRCCSIDEAQELVLVGDATGKLCIRTIQLGELLHIFEHGDVVRCAAFFTSNIILTGDQANTVTVRNVSVSPLPHEMPLSSVAIARRRPWLFHRPDFTDGCTILHRLASLVDAIDSLEEYLSCCREMDEEFAIVPVLNYARDGFPAETALDVALKHHHPAAAKMLLECYFSNVQTVIRYYRAYASMSQSLTLMARQYSDLLYIALDKAVIKMDTVIVGTKMALREPMFKNTTHNAPGMDFWKLHTAEKPKSLNDLIFDMWAQRTATPPPGKIRECQRKKQRPGVEVEVEGVLVGFPGFLASKGPFLAITQSRNLRAFETVVMGLAVRYKWESSGFWMHTLHFLLYLIGVALFFGGQIAHLLERNGARTIEQKVLPVHRFHTPITEIFSVTIAVMLFLFLYEMLHIHSISYQAYLRDTWNLYELLTLFSIIVACVLVVESSEITEDSLTSAFCGIADVLATFNVLTFLRPYKLFGPLVRMLEQIVVDISGLLVLQIVVIVGFSMAFMILLPDSPSYQAPLALLTSFEMMLGSWDLNAFDFFVPSELLATLAVVAFVIYMVFFFVITMNLLISIMADSYSNVRQNQLVEGRIQTAEVLCNVDGVLSGFAKYFGYHWEPQNLHALVPVTIASLLSDTESWSDRLQPLKQHVANLEKEIKVESRRGQEFLNAKMDALDIISHSDLQRIMQEQEERLTARIVEILRSSHNHRTTVNLDTLPQSDQ